MTTLKLKCVKIDFRANNEDGTELYHTVEGYLYPNGTLQVHEEMHHDAFYQSLTEFVGSHDDTHLETRLTGETVNVTLAQVARSLKDSKSEYGFWEGERETFWGGLLGARRVH